ncbi:hypothetical protein DXG01_005845, partial [Tephrocybe rancida]
MKGDNADYSMFEIYHEESDQWLPLPFGCKPHGDCTPPRRRPNNHITPVIDPSREYVFYRHVPGEADGFMTGHFREGEQEEEDEDTDFTIWGKSTWFCIPDNLRAPLVQDLVRMTSPPMCSPPQSPPSSPPLFNEISSDGGSSYSEHAREHELARERLVSRQRTPECTTEEDNDEDIELQHEVVSEDEPLQPRVDKGKAWAVSNDDQEDEWEDKDFVMANDLGPSHTKHYTTCNHSTHLATSPSSPRKNRGRFPQALHDRCSDIGAHISSKFHELAQEVNRPITSLYKAAGINTANTQNGEPILGGVAVKDFLGPNDEIIAAALCKSEEDDSEECDDMEDEGTEDSGTEEDGDEMSEGEQDGHKHPLANWTRSAAKLYAAKVKILPSHVNIAEAKQKDCVDYRGVPKALRHFGQLLNNIEIFGFVVPTGQNPVAAQMAGMFYGSHRVAQMVEESGMDIEKELDTLSICFKAHKLGDVPRLLRKAVPLPGRNSGHDEDNDRTPRPTQPPKRPRGFTGSDADADSESTLPLTKPQRKKITGKKVWRDERDTAHGSVGKCFRDDLRVDVTGSSTLQMSYTTFANLLLLQKKCMYNFPGSIPIPGPGGLPHTFSSPNDLPPETVKALAVLPAPPASVPPPPAPLVPVAQMIKPLPLRAAPPPPPPHPNKCPCIDSGTADDECSPPHRVRQNVGLVWRPEDDCLYDSSNDGSAISRDDYSVCHAPYQCGLSNHYYDIHGPTGRTPYEVSWDGIRQSQLPNITLRQMYEGELFGNQLPRPSQESAPWHQPYNTYRGYQKMGYERGPYGQDSCQGGGSADGSRGSG